MIKEANEICKMLGKNISFKQVMIQNFVDEATGRRSSISALSNFDDLARQLSTGSMKSIKEEMQVQVRNHDKKTNVMWTEEMFFDRLEMLRDTLNQFEDAKQRAIEL
jgi:hypothetical protein